MDEVDLMLASHYGSDWGSEVTGKAIVWPTHDNWVTFKGRASHASSSPEKGRSALDAVILTTMGLEFLREHMPETNRIHYIISKGGTAANSVPDLATLNVELRTNDSAELNSLMKRVDNVIKGTALMTDTTPVHNAPWYCAPVHPVPQSGPVCRGSGNRQLPLHLRKPAQSFLGSGLCGLQNSSGGDYLPHCAGRRACTGRPCRRDGLYHGKRVSD
ncbi:MAG: peptidase dimerization domain-containing protein [Clostridium sp.]